jgi:hypothetical protein
MSKASPSIRTPGEDAPTLDEGVGFAGSDALNESRAPTLSMTMEERFAAMEAEQATLRAENASLKGLVQDISKQAPRAADLPAVILPRAASFTAAKQAKMESAVLTQDGWVVPAHLGSSPVLNELQKLGLSGTA